MCFAPTWEQRGRRHSVPLCSVAVVFKASYSAVGKKYPQPSKLAVELALSWLLISNSMLKLLLLSMLIQIQN